MSDSTDVLRKIDASLARMREKGYANTIHYERLLAKRNAIANGASYTIINVAPYLISYISTLIPNLNIGQDGDLLEARGNRVKAVLEVVEKFKEKVY